MSPRRIRTFTGLSVLRPRRGDRPAPEDPWFHGRPLNRSRAAAGLVWLGFIAAPMADAIGHDGHGVGYGLTIAAAVAFAVVYVWLVFTWLDVDKRWRASVLSVLLAALAVALTVFDRPSWGYLFSYVAATAALTVPAGWSFAAVFLTTVAAAAATALRGGSSGTAASFAISTVGVGLLLSLMRDLRMRNQELNEARAELARTAVAAERERFARDLHDLLGHSLSVIAIKAELAGRLLPDRSDEAAGEIGDVEHVARQALSEVRDAVSGYRQPTLAGEMEGARVALPAAGIIAEFERPPVTLDPDVEAVLAWTVREGATNVIRHSGASRCQVRVRAGLADAEVEVVDDGGGCAAASGAGANGGGAGGGGGGGGAGGGAGNGLAGLRERAERLRGGIIAEFERSPATLDPDVEAVLAWTVREGATNVIRHSGASRCQVRVRAGLADAEVEVVDDGGGCAAANGAGANGGGAAGGAGGGGAGGGAGNGLAGLRERAERLRGRIDAGTLPDGGFRLAVSVPVKAAGGS